VGSVLMARSQNGNVIQMLLFQSIPSRTHAQGERAGYIFIYILDPNYVFTPPETPTKCPQQQVSAPSMLSGDCLHMFTYPALPGIPPAHPALHPAPSACVLLSQGPHFQSQTAPATLAGSFFLAGGEYLVWTYDMFQASPGY